MDDQHELTSRFEEHRPRLRGVAYRMLGSLDEADDAVQEAWLRLQRTNAEDVENLGGWLTTVVARISLNLLRARNHRREVHEDDVGAPDVLVGPPDRLEPEHQALLADSVGVALLVVLETLSPVERLAFVLHDVFGVPFDEIAVTIDRTPAAARQLASRARRRVRSAAPAPDAGLAAQREVVDAFFAAGYAGDFDGLVAVLAPDVVLRGDHGPVITGAGAVAGQARMFATTEREARPATVDGAAGAVVFVGERPVAVMGFAVVAGRIAAIDAITDPRRLEALDLTAFNA
jgi:RNA polymerase sigma factor (sigma-70 family)